MPHGLPHVPKHLTRKPRRWRFERYLVDDWRLVWRFGSAWASGALAVLAVLQAEVLPLFQFAIPPKVWPWVVAVLSTLAILLRVLRQSAVDRERARLRQDESRASTTSPGSGL